MMTAPTSRISTSYMNDSACTALLSSVAHSIARSSLSHTAGALYALFFKCYSIACT